MHFCNISSNNKNTFSYCAVGWLLNVIINLVSRGIESPPKMPLGGSRSHHVECLFIYFFVVLSDVLEAVIPPFKAHGWHSIDLGGVSMTRDVRFEIELFFWAESFEPFCGTNSRSCREQSSRIDKTFHKDRTKYSFTAGESDIMITSNHGMTTELKKKNHMKIKDC